MGHNENDPRQPGAWTPFVGVALAVLTAGSLVLFSFVAQRTSLDGFETRGVTAVAPSGATPPSITLPGEAPAAAPQSDATGEIFDGTTAASLLSVSPTSSLLGSESGSVPQTASAPTPRSGADVAAGPDRTVGSTGNRLQASFSGGGDRATLFRGAETTDGKNQAKAKDKKSGKAKNNGKTKKDKGKKDKKAKGRAASHKERGDSGGSGHGSASHNSSPGRSAASSAPAHSSRPAPRPKPQKAAKSSSGHPNTKGKGHSKGRGRGHAND